MYPSKLSPQFLILALRGCTYTQWTPWLRLWSLELCRFALLLAENLGNGDKYTY